MHKKGSFEERSLEARLFNENSITPVTLNTQKLYEKKLLTLHNHALRLNMEPHFLKLPSVINKLIEEGELSRNTIKIFRSALLHKLYEEALMAISMNEDLDIYKTVYDETRSIIAKDQTKKVSHQKVSQNTSSAKTKYFDEKFYNYCIAELANKVQINRTFRRSEASNDAYKMMYYFLKANVILGLRPIEWFDASESTYLLTLQDNYSTAKRIPALSINNAKHTNGRANGESRDILLTGINDDQSEAITELISLFRKYNLKSTDPERILRMLTKKMDRLGETYISANSSTLTDQEMADIKSTSLYSTRHQAINNAKMSGFSKIKIAGMFGHVSINTHSKHYGKKGKGWMKLNVQPSPESILAVNAPVLLSDLNIQNNSL